MIRSKNSNTIYWEQGVYPDWTAISAFRGALKGLRGTGVEPHYHDNDEIWLFTEGRGEVWLDDQRFDVTPNTAVYTPMGVVHRFQMFTDYENNAIVTRLERQKRPIHILVEEAGPPVPTVPGFVIPGADNTGPFTNRGPRCPLGELRCVTLAAGEGLDDVRLSRNEHWLILDGTVHLAFDGWEVELSQEDVALLRAGVVRRIRSDEGARAVLARE
ncbi:MAG: cupin domain-containing protein [Candidatus Latescibacteria bacterium]|nr:cupin domain-containing protein [Candidatus Latescibacterota bacterium]